MHILMNQEVWWVQSLMTVWVIKYKNDMHAPAALQNPFRLFGIWTIKINILKTYCEQGKIRWAKLLPFHSF